MGRVAVDVGRGSGVTQFVGVGKFAWLMGRMRNLAVEIFPKGGPSPGKCREATQNTDVEPLVELVTFLFRRNNNLYRIWH